MPALAVLLLSRLESADPDAAMFSIDMDGHQIVDVARAEVAEERRHPGRRRRRVRERPRGREVGLEHLIVVVGLLLGVFCAAAGPARPRSDEPQRDQDRRGLSSQNLHGRRGDDTRARLGSRLPGRRTRITSPTNPLLTARPTPRASMAPLRIVIDTVVAGAHRKGVRATTAAG